MDFTGVSTILTFTSGDTSMCVGITITMDILLEDDETFIVLATSTDSSIVFTNDQTLVTITSNDSMYALYLIITMVTSLSLPSPYLGSSRQCVIYL